MRKLLGGLLLAVGVLVAGACGLCSGWFLIATLTAPNGGDEASAMIALAAIVGGIPFMGGVGLVLAGRYLLRSRRPDYRPGDDTFS